MPTLSRPQARVFQSTKRFRVLVAGRRFGKTYLAVAELLRGTSWPGFTAWLIAPTYRQAKQIAWKRLKELAAPLILKTNETDLSVELSTGGFIALRGADNYDSLRGVGLDGVIFDEAADIAPEVWTEVVRPALSDRLGWALFIGTPKGFDKFHDLYTEALDKPDWAAFKYTTLDGGQVPESEVSAARLELDEKTFRQEYEASFEETSQGKCYYAFTREDNVTPIQYDPRLPICYSLDFNVNPICSIIAQIHDYAPNIYTSSQTTKQLKVLEEICIQNSNIPESVNEFIRRTRQYARPGYPLQVRIYGDPAGNARSHAGPTDYNVVAQQFKQDSNYQLSWHVATAHPAVRDRVNSVNSLLRTAAGTHRLFIDPSCKELIKDLEQVIWKTDTAGNSLNDVNKSKSERTHAVDALGYLCNKEFPLTGGSSGYQSTRII